MTTQDPPTTTASADPLIGRVFNERFKVQRLLARGGLSAVYRAEQAPLGRTCALKVLRPRYEGAIQFEFHRRFFLEASIASKLTHPNNVTVFDYGHTDDDVYFMAMEYLEGRTLAQVIRAEAPFSEERILHIARQVCRALREAHSLGVIHRDIKPGNIFLVERADEDDFVKVIDYGLVKDIRASDTTEELTQAGLFMGSPKYVSPEQIQGDAVDGRADIYSFGAVLYEMATGRVPFERNSDVQTLIAHVKDEPRPLQVANPSCTAGPLLEQLILKCLAKNPAERFASTDQLLHLLKQGTDAALTGTITSESGRLLEVSPSGAVAPLDARTGTLSGPLVFLAGGATGPSAAIDPEEAERAAATARKARRLRTLMASGAAVAALVATAVLFGIRARSADGDSRLAVSSNAPAGEVSRAAPEHGAASQDVGSAAVPEASATVKLVRIESEPTGASVLLGGPRGKTLCDSTPCDVQLGAELGNKVDIYVARRGFVTGSRELSRDDDKVTVRLSPAAVAAPPPTRTTPTSTATESGWGKVDPY